MKEILIKMPVCIGSPLDMHEESGLAALRKANLLDEFKKNFRPGADRMIIVNEQCRNIFQRPRNQT